MGFKRRLNIYEGHGQGQATRLTWRNFNDILAKADQHSGSDHQMRDWFSLLIVALGLFSVANGLLGGEFPQWLVVATPLMLFYILGQLLGIRDPITVLACVFIINLIPESFSEATLALQKLTGRGFLLSTVYIIALSFAT